MSVVTALLVSADRALSSAVLRLAAAAGVTVEVLEPAALALRAWAAAPAVLVGAGETCALARASLPRRDQVHVLALGRAPDAVFRDAVAVGAASVLELPEADGRLVALLSDLGDLAESPSDPSRDRASTVAVVGGAGGAGASVFAAGLALVAGTTGTAALIDLDPLGPCIHRVVGLDRPDGVTWRELAESRGRLGARALRDALPKAGEVRVLGWPDGAVAALPAGLPGEVLSAAARGHDHVVLDLPRHADASLLSLAARCDQVVLVAGSGLGGIAATARVAGRLREETDRLGLVARTGRGAPPGEDVARALGLPLLAEVPHDRRLAEHLDLGLGPVHRPNGAVAAAARRVLGALGTGRAGTTR